VGFDALLALLAALAPTPQFPATATEVAPAGELPADLTADANPAVDPTPVRPRGEEELLSSDGFVDAPPRVGDGIAPLPSAAPTPTAAVPDTIEPAPDVPSSPASPASPPHEPASLPPAAPVRARDAHRAELPRPHRENPVEADGVGGPEPEVEQPPAVRAPAVSGSGDAGGAELPPRRREDELGRAAAAVVTVVDHTPSLAPVGSADAAASAAMPDVPVADLAAQLAEPLGQLDVRVDGDHEVTVRLDPAELGPVALRVRVEGGAVHVHLDAARPDTGHLLAQALPELRHALESAGIAAGALQLGGAGVDPRDRRGDHGDPSDRRNSAAAPAPPSGVGRHQDAPLPTRSLTAADGRVDLVL
jgi:hypothetical protein